jgi:hypothetical protein
MAFARVVLGQNIRLSALFRDGMNVPTDPDGADPYFSDATTNIDSTGGRWFDSTTEPNAIIYDPNEKVLIYVDHRAIVRQEQGFYYYDHMVHNTDAIGIYRIRWEAHIYGVPVIYDDYFQVTSYPTIISGTLIQRIKRELKDLSEELNDEEYQDVQLDAEADVMEMSIYGLAWHNKWEILWLTKRGVRHALQRILNNWLTMFSIGKGGKSLALDQPARAIMQRLTQIDTEFEKAKEVRWFDGVHWIYRPKESATTSAVQTMAYDVDPYTGLDRTPYYDSEGRLHRINDDEDLDYWREY